jgi:ribosomal protein S18
MANNNSKKPRGRAPKELNPKKFKKKTSVLITEKVVYVDYKDVNLLARFVSDRSKIRNRRVTGNDVQQQRDVALAVKNAREMALLPYTKRPPRPGHRVRATATVASVATAASAGNAARAAPSAPMRPPPRARRPSPPARPPPPRRADR